MSGTPRRYFEDMYAGDNDPWGFDSSWYEARKRQLTVAALPDARYRSGFEPGCSNGALTAMLAVRCDRLLATDVIPAVVERARGRLADRRHVRVEQRAVPGEWPEGEGFDLVVLSEVAYYFDEATMAVVIERLGATLQPDGVLVGVHWRGPTDYPLTAEAAHRLLGSLPGAHRLVHHDEPQFVLDVWRRA